MDNLQQSIENVRHQKNTRSCDSADNNCFKGRPYPILLNHRVYPLNKSRSKFATVGLRAYGWFSPVVQLCGLKKDWIIFDEPEWKVFVGNKSAIDKYYEANELIPPPINLSCNKRILFQSVNSNKVIIVQDNSGGELWLGAETLKELWTILNIVEYNLEIQKSLEFHTFYDKIIKGIASMVGNYKENIVSVLDNLIVASENKVCMMEMLKFSEEIIKCDIEMEQVHEQISA